VHRNLAPQVAFHLDLALEDLAHATRLVLRPRLHALVVVDAGLRQHAQRGRAPDAIDVGQRDFAALLPGKVDACDSSHGSLLRSLSALALLVARVLADDPRDALPLDDLAILPPPLHPRSDFHLFSLSPFSFN